MLSPTTWGQRFEGYFAGDRDPRGVALIVHDRDAVGAYARRRADMLAQMGR